MDPEKTLAPATISKVNLAFGRLGIPLELVRGKGYHYYVFDTMTGPVSRAWRMGVYETESVMTPYTSQQPVDRWVADGVAWAQQFAVKLVTLTLTEDTVNTINAQLIYGSQEPQRLLDAERPGKASSDFITAIAQAANILPR